MLRLPPLPLRLAAFSAANAVLAWLCLAPQEDLQGFPDVWDKAEHAGAFGLLAAIGMVLFGRVRGMAAWALAYGALIEIAQATLPFGRDGEWQDLFADAVGVAVVFGVALWLERRRP